MFSKPSVSELSNGIGSVMQFKHFSPPLQVKFGNDVSPNKLKSVVIIILALIILNKPYVDEAGQTSLMKAMMCLGTVTLQTLEGLYSPLCPLFLMY